MSPGFDTRAAVPEDAEECAAILQEWIDETSWFPSRHPASAAASMLRQEILKNGLTLAMANDKIAGFSCMEAAMLSHLYVRGRYRILGVGRMLLQRCKFAQPDGFGLWTFQQNSGARRFYEREGFVEAERTTGADNEEGLPDIRYIWEGKHV